MLQLSRNVCEGIQIFSPPSPTAQQIFPSAALALLLFICLVVVPVPPTDGTRCGAPPAAASIVPGCLFALHPARTGRGKTAQDLSGDVRAWRGGTGVPGVRARRAKAQQQPPPWQAGKRSQPREAACSRGTSPAAPLPGKIRQNPEGESEGDINLRLFPPPPARQRRSGGSTDGFTAPSRSASRAHSYG